MKPLSFRFPRVSACELATTFDSTTSLQSLQSGELSSMFATNSKLVAMRYAYYLPYNVL